jgi:hypothetical protein
MNNMLILANGTRLLGGAAGPRVQQFVRTTGGFSTHTRRPSFG